MVYREPKNINNVYMTRVLYNNVQYVIDASGMVAALIARFLKRPSGHDTFQRAAFLFLCAADSILTTMAKVLRILEGNCTVIR